MTLAKMVLYCPQGSGTLCQQLLMMHGIACYCMLLHGIEWYSMVLQGIAWYCTVSHGIAWYCMVLQGTTWHCMVLQYLALSCSDVMLYPSPPPGLASPCLVPGFVFGIAAGARCRAAQTITMCCPCAHSPFQSIVNLYHYYYAINTPSK